MGSSVHWYVLLSAMYAPWLPWAWGQDLRERDALCSEEGCFVLYFQRRTFLDSWKSCKEKGGNLATVKSPEDAALIRELFSEVEPRRNRAKVRVWIGLQRQPRQCSATKPLRGFTWTTGDQDTQYTNWLRDDSASTCAAPRCVVMSHSFDKGDQRDNFKWLDGSCSLAVDGFLCRYNYKGMCPALQNEGGGPPLYTTPFNLFTSFLSHLPFGTVAAVPCLDGTKGDQTVLCLQREDGSIGWSKDTPLCSDATNSWCEEDNGGCEHYCLITETHYYCECSEGFLLAEDGQSCKPADTCLDASCEFECQPSTGGYLCVCPEGYLLAPDGRDCTDVDECLQSPCSQLCVNAPGTFECRCSEGYHNDESGDCVDVDECMEDLCAHACENTPGSYACHCHLGFSLLPEEPGRCQDTDECQIPGTCQQMCVNYEGGFECHCDEGYELQQDGYSCILVQGETELLDTTPSYPTITSLPEMPWIPQVPDLTWITKLPGWLTDSTPHDWLTEPPSVEWLPTDFQGSTDAALERSITIAPEDGRQTDDLIPGWVAPHWKENAGALSLGNTDEPAWTEEEDSPSFPQTTDWTGEGSTKTPALLPTSTPGPGAWHWLWHSSTGTPSVEDSEEQGTQHQGSSTGKGSQSTFGAQERTTTSHPSHHVLLTSPKSKAGESGLQVPDGESAADEGRPSSTVRHSPPLFLTPLSAITPVQGTEGQPGSGSKQRQDRSWLLVALLVPLSIFVVVMLALGIVYCTRCAVQPRSKSITECYRWITNSKSEANSSSSKSRV